MEIKGLDASWVIYIAYVYIVKFDNKIYTSEINLINSIKFLMTTSWLRPNLYVVQNGKLVPRPTTPEQKKNYRYIPFEPFHNPGP